MKLSHFFIDRPIFATVLSIITIIVGSISYFALPIAQYPEVAPPTIQVAAAYPGASAKVISETVATPLEQEINGVENMLYMESQSTSDGRMVLTITFQLGTDLDKAQVLVQNRVAIAEPRLPEPVRRLGVTTKKNSPDLLLVINLFSPGEVYEQTYIANYVNLQLRDPLARIDGVGDIRLFGASEYSMRIWLNPDRIASLNLTAQEVLQALRSQNTQIASGTLNQSPVTEQNAFEINIQTKGRLQTIEEFENIIVKSGTEGRVVRVKDIARVELGAVSYATRGYLGKSPAIALPINQRPGSNAIATVEKITDKMKELSQNFPPGLEYNIVYNPTEFVEQSINEVIKTMIEAVVLVVFVILVFLQSWRASIIPILAIPISLIGTFAVMQGFGFSLNNLTLFGLVLAIGIVVDDAIVVVENMERNMEEGFEPKEAARRTMDEVGGALIAMGLILVAVFLPTTFIGGISGRFFQQFGITISVATMISVIVSLTLSPALASILLKPKTENTHVSWWKKPFVWFNTMFNKSMNALASGYAFVVKKLIYLTIIVLLVYSGLIGLTAFQFNQTPKGFIPQQDQGYLIVAIQLPPGSSLDRTDKVVQKVTRKVLEIDGITNAVAFSGFDGASFTNSSNAATLFPTLASFKEREAKGLDYLTILQTLQAEMMKIEEAFVIVIAPPSVRGIGNSGGFKMMVQDRGGRGLSELKKSIDALIVEANKHPKLAGVFSFFNTDTPQVYFDIDRQRAEKLGVPSSEVFSALEVYLGSAFVNDFYYLGRTFQVTAQADASYRLTEDDVTRIRVRNKYGTMVPLGSLGHFRDIAGASRVPRYNLFPAAGVQGQASPGFSSDEAIQAMEEIAKRVLPEGISFEWTELAFQQKQSQNTAMITFSLAVVFVFLLLAAQYESWTLPLSVILIVPMCLLSAIYGVSFAEMDNNIMTQIGLVVLVGLASKNAILIVEFAKQLEDRGKKINDAAVEASKLRLRPILMTAFSFILGVIPLVIASGAGAEMRQAIGVTVFSGMLGVTVFGLLFTPVFYVVARKLSWNKGE